MNKKVCIILVSVLAAALIIAIAVLVWVFPLRDGWREELRAGFSSPEDAPRYVCDLSCTSRSSDADGPSERNYKAISNAPGEGVWRYVANARSGCYIAGDTCFEYSGDPLAGGTLVRAGEEASAPLPAYMDYFAFLFEKEPNFADEAKRINKFSWGGESTYTFSIPYGWFIEDAEEGMYSEYWHYSDVAFRVAQSAQTGRVVRARCSYDYRVDAHWEVQPDPSLPGYGPDFVAGYSVSVEAEAAFSYPEQDTPIETDAQFELVRDINAGRADKAMAQHAGEYLLPVPSADPAVEYVYPEWEEESATFGPDCKAFPAEDVFVVYYGGRADVYRASTLEKRCTLDFYLEIASVDVEDGKLLVTLKGGPLYTEDAVNLPWERNTCFVVYDLSDFSVLCRHKAKGKGNLYSLGYGYLFGDRIAYLGQENRICLYDMRSGETLETDCKVRLYLYADKENGRLIYDTGIQKYSAYDLATGAVTAEEFTPLLHTLHIEGLTLAADSWHETVSVTEDASGECVYTFDLPNVRVELGADFAVQMADGKYFCGMSGSLFVLDLSVVGAGA